MTNNEFEQLRARGYLWITAAGWVASLLFAVMAFLIDGANLAVVLGSIAMNAVPTYCVLNKRIDNSAMVGVALMAAAQPALLTYTMRGLAWQIDMHMYFFVALAMMTVLCSVRPILVAAAAIALHHLFLSFTAPSWVFAGGGEIGRVLIHAVAVVLQASALGFIAVSLAALFERNAAARQRSETLAADSELARERAEAALAEVEQEREARLREQREQAERRRAELLKFSQEFESSVAVVVTTVSNAAQALEHAASSLDEVASETGRQATEVASSSGQASVAVEAVASNVAQLVRSIRQIAENAAQQSELSTLARQKSKSGNSTVTTLSERSDTISRSTSEIADIAQRTNILALNATIAAVSAGGAGRGFAVVAQEVKSLALQSAKATETIVELLQGIRDGTEEAEESFARIADAIGELTSASEAIRRAVDQQRNVASNIETNARETAQGVLEVSTRIEELAANAERTGRYSGSVRTAASGLVEQSRALQQATQTFVQQLRSAA